MNEQVKRISRMEAALNRVQEAVDLLDGAWKEYLDAQDDIRILADYLNSEERRTDVSADEAGELPDDLPRGVLSQDAIWNLLERNDELAADMRNALSAPATGESKMKGSDAGTDYDLMLKQAQAIMEDVPHLTANLANISALIYQSLDHINWSGFYLTEGERLILGPFQGKVACVEIPYGKGVCGTAALQDETQLVPDVHLFKGHIACDSASRSEIVVPIHRNGAVFGVLDIDSPTAGRFTQRDKTGLEAIVALMEKQLFRN